MLYATSQLTSGKCPTMSKDRFSSFRGKTSQLLVQACIMSDEEHLLIKCTYHIVQNSGGKNLGELVISKFW